MTVALQRMFGILERWNNNQVTPSLSKPHELDPIEFREILKIGICLGVRLQKPTVLTVALSLEYSGVSIFRFL